MYAMINGHVFHLAPREAAIIVSAHAGFSDFEVENQAIDVVKGTGKCWVKVTNDKGVSITFKDKTIDKAYEKLIEALSAK